MGRVEITETTGPGLHRAKETRRDGARRAEEERRGAAKKKIVEGSKVYYVLFCCFLICIFSDMYNCSHASFFMFFEVAQHQKNIQNSKTSK